MSLALLIEELKEASAKAGLPCGDELLPPAAKEDLDILGAALGLPLPTELVALYSVHGGQRDIGAGVEGLFGRHRLYTPPEVAQEYSHLMEYCLSDPPHQFPPEQGQRGDWVPQLIPFAYWDAYDLCIDQDSGAVWEFEPYQGVGHHRPSIAALLRELLEMVRAGEEPRLV